MSEASLDVRVELERLRHAYDDLRKEIRDIRGVESGLTRRRGVLASAGTTAESLLKFIYRHEGKEKGGRPAANLMLEDLQQALKDTLPDHIQVPLRTVQAYRNLGSHDKGDIRNVDEQALLTVSMALNQVVVWFFENYLGGEFAALAQNREADETAAKSSTVSSSHDVWRELFWWLMRGGQLKLLDQKALEKRQRESGLSDADVEAIRGAYRRDAEMFRQALQEAFDDEMLEDYEADGLEEVRILGCVSAREAQEIAAAALSRVARLPGNAPAWMKRGGEGARSVEVLPPTPVPPGQEQRRDVSAELPPAPSAANSLAAEAPTASAEGDEPYEVLRELSLEELVSKAERLFSPGGRVRPAWSAKEVVDELALAVSRNLPRATLLQDPATPGEFELRFPGPTWSDRAGMQCFKLEVDAERMGACVWLSLVDGDLFRCEVPNPLVSRVAAALMVQGAAPGSAVVGHVARSLPHDRVQLLESGPRLVAGWCEEVRPVVEAAWTALPRWAQVASSRGTLRQYRLVDGDEARRDPAFVSRFAEELWENDKVEESAQLYELLGSLGFSDASRRARAWFADSPTTAWDLFGSTLRAGRYTDTLGLLIDGAHHAASARQWKESVALSLRALTLFPVAADELLVVGRRLRQAGLPDLAERVLRLAHGHRLEGHRSAFELARLLAETGRGDAAIDVLNTDRKSDGSLLKRAERAISA
ncbi:MAG: hypothetical protein RL653_4467, partial [Pseudomonadota bacterium]